jgi:hypothetical protein
MISKTGNGKPVPRPCGPRAIWPYDHSQNLGQMELFKLQLFAAQ